jgi:hemoglobin
MARLRQHTAALLSTVTGGPASYQGRELGVAHAHLGITEADFLRVVEHLVTVLEGARVSSASIDAVVSALAMHKNEIVTAGAPAERSADGRGR